MKQILVTASILLLASCDTNVGPLVRDLSLELEVDRSERAVGEDFTFTFRAEGRQLAAVTLDYGDGTTESIPLHGAQTGTGVRTHAYTPPGVFQVVAELMDTWQDTRTATVSVTVTDTVTDPAP